MDKPTPADSEKPPAPAPPAPHEPTPQGDEASPPEPAASTAEPTRKERRSSEFWLAVLGVAGTVLGAITGGVATYVTSQASFTHDTVREQTSFMRSQQLEAYAAFDSAINDFSDSIWTEQTKYTGPIQLGGPPPKDFATSSSNLDRADIKLQFCGSDEVNIAGQEVLKRVFAIYHAIDSFESSHPPKSNPPPSFDEINGFINNVNTLHGDLWAAQDNFHNAARKDLGFSPLPRSSSAPSPESRPR